VNDPNGDLIGYEFRTEYGPVRVTGSCSWNPAYIEVAYVDGTGTKSVRPAKLVRRSREIEREEAHENARAR
jgi:hypothetical protein